MGELTPDPARSAPSGGPGARHSRHRSCLQRIATACTPEAMGRKAPIGILDNGLHLKPSSYKVSCLVQEGQKLSLTIEAFAFYGSGSPGSGS